ncbi:hypothetical protein K3495_g2290 [Podosphaera aphanis]|nr:hypothetical protein K3495_g2290 [Podosphaera aphanis]
MRVNINDSGSLKHSDMDRNKVLVVEIPSPAPSKIATKPSPEKLSTDRPSRAEKGTEGNLPQCEKIRPPESLSPEAGLRGSTSTHNVTPPALPASKGESTEPRYELRNGAMSSHKTLKDESSPSKKSVSKARKNARSKPIDSSPSKKSVPKARKNARSKPIDSSPSKKSASKARKKVRLELIDELQLESKDLPVVPRAQKLRKTNQSRSVAVGKTKDLNSPVNSHARTVNTACEACHKTSSSKDNPMLLCDGSDCGYHIKCLGLTQVPEIEPWYCPKCQPDLTTTVAPADIIPAIEDFDYQLRCQQQDILDKLTGKKRVRLKGLSDEMQKVQQIVEQTVLAGEGNSMLIIGSRGTGKTTLVESVITEISRKHRESFHVVRLNGFIHTDDKLALKEIWRQLGKEMDVSDDSVGQPGSYADTLLTLLALLSHPSEIMGDSDSNQTAVSVIFILDEFDLFTLHHRQTLLYNLFDIAQSRKAPIVVLGLTTKVDISEGLEKRVKSRFSHRFIYLSLPRSLPEFWEICKEYLVNNEDDDGAWQSNKAISPSYDKFDLFWRAMIDDLYNDAAFTYHLQSIFYRTKSVPVFMNSCILPIVNLSAQNPVLCGAHFTSSYLPLGEPESKLQILQGLSELELALLIAAARLDIILDIDTCNFSMAYDEYISLTSLHKIQASSAGMAALGVSTKVWGRDISFEAWEKLVNYELLVPAGLGGGHARNLEAVGRMWKVDVDLEEIVESVDGLSRIMTKWCKKI